MSRLLLRLLCDECNTRVAEIREGHPGHIEIHFHNRRPTIDGGGFALSDTTTWTLDPGSLPLHRTDTLTVHCYDKAHYDYPDGRWTAEIDTRRLLPHLDRARRYAKPRSLHCADL